jgi:hypothetical protein
VLKHNRASCLGVHFRKQGWDCKQCCMQHAVWCCHGSMPFRWGPFGGIPSAMLLVLPRRLFCRACIYIYALSCVSFSFLQRCCAVDVVGAQGPCAGAACTWQVQYACYQSALEANWNGIMLMDRDPVRSGLCSDNASKALARNDRFRTSLDGACAQQSACSQHLAQAIKHSAVAWSPREVHTSMFQVYTLWGPLTTSHGQAFLALKMAAKDK